MERDVALGADMQPDVFVRTAGFSGASYGLNRELNRSEVVQLLRELDRVITLLEGVD